MLIGVGVGVDVWVGVGLGVGVEVGVGVGVGVGGGKLAILMSQAPRPCVEARSVRVGLCNVSPRTAVRGNPVPRDVQLVPPAVL
jgi:hypothetical protein